MIKNLFFDTFLSEIQQLGIKFYIEEEDEGNEDEPILLVLDDFVTAVWEATSQSEVNFALSKSAFAHYISHEVPSETACSAFRLLYDVIMQIIEDDRKQQETGKAIKYAPSE